jgi:hypothetical protein
MLWLTVYIFILVYVFHSGMYQTSVLFLHFLFLQYSLWCSNSVIFHRSYINDCFQQENWRDRFWKSAFPYFTLPTTRIFSHVLATELQSIVDISVTAKYHVYWTYLANRDIYNILYLFVSHKSSSVFFQRQLIPHREHNVSQSQWPVTMRHAKLWSSWKVSYACPLLIYIGLCRRNLAKRFKYGMSSKLLRWYSRCSMQKDRRSDRLKDGGRSFF